MFFIIMTSVLLFIYFLIYSNNKSKELQKIEFRKKRIAKIRKIRQLRWQEEYDKGVNERRELLNITINNEVNE